MLSALLTTTHKGTICYGYVNLWCNTSELFFVLIRRDGLVMEIPCTETVYLIVPDARNIQWGRATAFMLCLYETGFWIRWTSGLIQQGSSYVFTKDQTHSKRTAFDHDVSEWNLLLHTQYICEYHLLEDNSRGGLLLSWIPRILWLVRSLDLHSNPSGPF